MTATLPALSALRPNPLWLELPLFDRKGWKRVRFGDVVENCNETCEPAEAGLERFVAMEHLEPGSLHVRSWGNVADGTTFTRRCQPGQVLFGKRRAYQRKVAVSEFEAVVSGDIYVLAPKDTQRLLPELLPFLCLSERFFQHAVGTSAGSLSPRTNWSSLASFEFDLPPLDQQRRIAEILWAVDDSIQGSTMLAASLRFVAEAKMRENVWNPNIKRFDFGEYVEIIDPNPSHRYPASVKDGVPLLATSDFEGENGFSYDSCQRVPRVVYEGQLARCRFTSTDVVFARKGVIGLARPYGGQPKCFSHTIAMMKPRENRITPEFLLELVRSEGFLSEISRTMNSNSGVPTLGLQTIAAIKVPIPKLDAQRQIDRDLGQLQTARFAANAAIQGTNGVLTTFLSTIIS